MPLSDDIREALSGLVVDLATSFARKSDIILTSPRSVEPDGTVVIRVSAEDWESIRSWEPSDFVDEDEDCEVYDPSQDPAVAQESDSACPL